MVKQTRYMLDTDTVIAMLRDRTDRSGLRQKALNVGLENCFVSAISVAELTAGAHRMSSERGLQEVEFIKTIFNVHPFGLPKSKDTDTFGVSKALLLGSGNPIADMDLLIGTSALAGGFVMVTHNTRHFAHIPNLQIEDWIAAGLPFR